MRDLTRTVPETETISALPVLTISNRGTAEGVNDVGQVHAVIKLQPCKKNSGDAELVAEFAR